MVTGRWCSTAITPDTVLEAVRKLGTNVTVNLLGSSVEDRPGVLASLLPAVVDIRAKYGRPHWILVDEAHHVLPRGHDAGDGINLDNQMPSLFITVHPDTLAVGVLQSLGVVLIIGRESVGLIEPIAKAIGRAPPTLPERGPETGEAIYWNCRGGEPPVLVTVGKPKGALRRHTRKYAEGTLGEDRSFFFRGPAASMNIRAQNLSMFLQVGEGVDADSYLFHLRNGDFETWMRTSIKDDELADEVANVAAQKHVDLDEARKLVRLAIEQRYTAPASPTQ